MEQWLRVKVHPSAGKDVLVMLGPARFDAWVNAKPAEGMANAAVIRLLARHLRVAEGRIRLVKGRHSRLKLFKVRAE
jgi:uncharacterized protein YggU (UPF0235/DUF167 family)